MGEMPRAKRDPRHASGRLFLIGGGETRAADGEVLSAFVDAAGGRRSCIVVCGAAMDDPADTLKEYGEVFRALGAEVYLEPFSDRRRGEDAELLEAVERCTAIFFTGGDQLQSVSRMAGTTFATLVGARLGSGKLLVGGTSAGAAAAGSVMTVGGPAEGTVRRADVDLAPGLAYWPNVLVDTHFNERGRVHRLMAVFAQNPGVLGVGLDENTAVRIDLGAHLRVVGTGAVVVFDGRISHSNADDAAPEDILALTDATVHVLAPRYGFDLSRMRPLLPESDRPLPPPKHIHH